VSFRQSCVNKNFFRKTGLFSVKRQIFYDIQADYFALRGKHFPVIPGHPFVRVFRNHRGIFLQSLKIFKRVYLAQAAGMNKTHKKISNISTIWSLVKQ